jgi:hypothetical protein
MILDRDGVGLNWYTNDPAHLYFSKTGEHDSAPTEICAFTIGRGGVVRPATRVVSLETLRYLGCGVFGPSRPCGFSSTTRWTGDAFKVRNLPGCEAECCNHPYRWRRNYCLRDRRDGCAGHLVENPQRGSPRTNLESMRDAYWHLS